MEKLSHLAVTWVFVRVEENQDAPVNQMQALPGFVERFNPAVPMDAKAHKSVLGVPLGHAKQNLRLDVSVFFNQQQLQRHLLVRQTIVKRTVWQCSLARSMDFRIRSVQMTAIITGSILEALQQGLLIGGGWILAIIAF